MAIIISDTQYLGKNLIFLKSIDSSNSYAKELLTNSKPKNGTVILAEEQTAGRGQAGNSWQSNAGENLTCSIIINTSWMPANEQFSLNMAVSLAVLRTIKFFLKDEAEVSVKWPNDVLVDKQKICGILIENTIYGNNLLNSIIGIGLNVNQKDFGEYVQATSIRKITQKTVDLLVVLKKLLIEMEHYLSLIQNKALLKDNYLRNLFLLNQESRFTYDEREVSGIIRNINDAGQLIIEIDGNICVVNMKEIRFIY